MTYKIVVGLDERGVGLLWELYEGETRVPFGFGTCIMVFDLVTILFLVVTSFVRGNPLLELADAAIGLADVAVIISFLAPVGGEGLGFLRALRVLRLFRSYRVVSPAVGNYLDALYFTVTTLTTAGFGTSR